jgi:hypothetical protein
VNLHPAKGCVQRLREAAGAPAPAFWTWESTNLKRADSEQSAPPQVAAGGLHIISLARRTIIPEVFAAVCQAKVAGKGRIIA